MSCFLISLPLFFCTPRPALLLLSVPPAPLPLDSVLVFVSSLLVSVSLSSPVGIDAGQQSIREFQSLCFFFSFFSLPLSFLCFDCFTVTVYVDSLFSLDSVFAGIQNWPTSLADTFFLADTESQGLPLSHSP